MRPCYTAVLSFTLASPAVAGPAVVKTVLDNLPERALFSAVAVEDIIYAFKFADEAFTTPGGDVYAWHPKSGRWSARAKAPLSRANASLVRADSRLFAIGGFTAPNTPTGAVEEYVPATNSWIRRKEMPTPRGRLGTVLLDGRIYALGGTGKDGVHTDAVEVYDLATDTWSQKHRLSKPLMGIQAVAARGRIYKLKGTEVRDGRWTFVMDFEEYDPVADVWTRKAPWVFESEPLDVALLDGRLFVFGAGAFSGAQAHSLKEYDFQGDRWLIRKDMPPANAHTVHPAWAVLAGKLYTFGGGFREAQAWKHSDRAQRYDPRTDSWEELPPLTEGKLYMPPLASEIASSSWVAIPALPASRKTAPATRATSKSIPSANERIPPFASPRRTALPWGYH
jgi:hypothetical protein